MIIGLDAKRIVRNGTGLGSYGRTLVNDLIRMGDSHLSLRLYAPDEGRDELRVEMVMCSSVILRGIHHHCGRHGGVPAVSLTTWWKTG